MNPLLRKKLKPEYLLILLGVAATLAFSVWLVLLNNFAIEAAAFTGREIGILQSLREVPGFLAFTTVFILLILREQIFALLAIAVLGAGVALTGFLPSEYGLYFTTVLMSTGFHYFYTVQQSLTLQWIEKGRTPEVMGRLSSASSIAALLVFAVVWAGMEYFGFGYRALYLAAGGIALLLVIVAVVLFPFFPENRRSCRHCLDSGRIFHDQPYCRRGDSSLIRDRVAAFSKCCFYCRRDYGRVFSVASQDGAQIPQGRQ